MLQMDLKDLHGLPLERAVEILTKRNIPYRIIGYESLRGPLGTDRRVLRAVFSQETAELVVSGFCTELNGEKIGQE